MPGINDMSLNGQLIESIRKDDYKEVATLLENGADPNGFIDGDKLSPLFFAAVKNAIRSARLLLAAGADPYYYCEAHESSPIEVAHFYGYRQMATLLKEYRK